MKEISLKINGQNVTAPEGATLLGAAKAAGIDIPTLCHYEGLEPAGVCRFCMVEITKGERSRLVASCVYPVEEGLEVQTETERTNKVRRMIIELLMPDAPTGPVSNYARRYGIEKSRFEPIDDEVSNCTLCGLCVRLCQRMGPRAIDFAGRGAEIKISTPFDAKSEECVACGACASICPTGRVDVSQITDKPIRPILSEYNAGLSGRKPIYIPYPQAIPNAPAIDRTQCAHFINDGCKVCAEFCPAGAIDHEQTDEEIEIEVGSVILAPGHKPFDPSGIDTYAYTHPNVVTTLEFERMLSPGGPFKGHIARASDGKEPKKIAWIQCVGSRSEKEGFNPYCSSFCCMASLKQTIIAREHIGPDLETAVFFMDMRTPRKDFEKYFERAKGLGVRLIRSRVPVMSHDGAGDLYVQYMTEEGEPGGETFDMVVLSVGLTISNETKELAGKLGVRLGPNGFVDASCFEPVTASRPGFFACGAFTGPKDIPQSVTEGSAAAAAATRGLSDARGSLLKKRTYPPEKEVAGQTPRIGIFICNCGTNIGGVADVPALVEYARSIPDVEYAQENLFSCADDAQKQMAEKIREYDLNRVVVAACSPSTHQPIFQDMLRNAGLNKYLFEMANIRNHCTWVHQSKPEMATGKCKDLIRMAAAKARLIEPLEYLSVGINRKALVIGGGMAGMTSALAMADQGYYVDLVERLDHLGGNALKLHTSWRKERIEPFVQETIAKVENHEKIGLHFQSIVVGVEGAVGNYKTRLSSGAEIEHGIAVVAIGAEPLRPEGQYLYMEHPNVLLSLDLDQELAKESPRVRNAEAAAFIQCVGSRIPERPYCNKLCCAHAVENALRLKEMNPGMDIYIIYRDMLTLGERESLYTEARRKGVLFFRYQPDNPPKVDYFGDRIKITVTDLVLRRPVDLEVDILTLATAIIPHRNAPLAELYKIPLNAEGFFTEAHAKIRPVDSSTEGIFLAGLCHYPKPIQESIAEALATASRASTLLSRSHLDLESTISHPIDENCDGCAYCIDVCPFKAITLIEYMKQGSLKKTVEVNETMCKGCGSCMATCPKRGIHVAGFTMEQLGAQVDAALGQI